MPAADCPKCVIRPVNAAAVNLLPCLTQRYALLVRVIVHLSEVACAVCVIVEFWVHVCVFVV